MSLDTAGPAVHASIAGPLLYTQLSPAGIGGLRELAMSYQRVSLVRIPLKALWTARLLLRMVSLPPCMSPALLVKAMMAQLCAVQDTTSFTDHPAINSATESRAELTLKVSSQHLRFDFCMETPAAPTSIAERDKQRHLLDAVASLSVSDLQVTSSFAPS